MKGIQVVLQRSSHTPWSCLEIAPLYCEGHAKESERDFHRDFNLLNNVLPEV
jgi:hypothetical protein